MRSLITGVRGFSGSHLARLLVDEGEDVTGVDVPESSRSRLDGMGLADLPTIEADLRQPDAVAEVMGCCRPHRVYHLAGLSGREGLAEMLEGNVVATDHLLRGCEEIDPLPRVLLISSAGVYGPVPAEDQPITEDRPMNPANAYAVSKAVTELIGLSHWLLHGLEVVIARTFNLMGPEMPPERVAGAVQEQLAQIADGSVTQLELGRLDAVRDFIDVDVAMLAYRALAARGLAGDAYNVCSGVGTRVRDLVDDLVAGSGLSDVVIKEASAGPHPGDVDVSVGDGGKLAALLAASYTGS